MESQGKDADLKEKAMKMRTEIETETMMQTYKKEAKKKGQKGWAKKSPRV